MTYEKQIIVEGWLYDYVESQLESGEPFEKTDRDGVPYVFTARFPLGYEVDIKVCNAEKEGGGPYIDPVLFQDGHEVCTAEVDESLTSEFQFDDEKNHFTVTLKSDHE